MEVAEDVIGKSGQDVEYKFGTMIEVPRAALTAGQIAEEAEFFSFGTNDLTQTTYGFSRDDAEGKFLGFYQDAKLLTNNPFQVIDPDGVGQANPHGRRRRAGDPAGPGDRHLRRARRRSGVGRVLPPGRPGLRQLVAVPGPGGAAGGSAGRDP